MLSLISFVPVAVWAVLATVGVLCAIDLATQFVRSIVSTIDGKVASTLET